MPMYPSPLQKSTNSLWFGRDVFGRRSLLWHLPVAGESLMVSSVGHYDPQDMPLVPSWCWQCGN